MRSGNALTLAPPLPAFAPPEMRAMGLPPFAPENWEQVERAFAHAPCCVLRQGWKALDADFQAAFARIGVSKTSDGVRTLWILAELRDREVFNAATTRNQRTWELGDVFEIFLAPSGFSSYFEFHVTPGNQVLEREIPLDCSDSEELWALDEPVLKSWTQIARGRDVWHVLAAIPLEKLGAQGVSRFKFSLSRYDATRGQAPVLSSSSPHADPNFHRIEDWGDLLLPT